MSTEICALSFVNSKGPNELLVGGQQRIEISGAGEGCVGKAQWQDIVMQSLTSNEGNESACRCPGGSKASNRGSVGIFPYCVCVDKGINTEMLLNPGGIRVLRLLVRRHRNRPNEGDACHRSRDAY